MIDVLIYLLLSLPLVGAYAMFAHRHRASSTGRRGCSTWPTARWRWCRRTSSTTLTQHGVAAAVALPLGGRARARCSAIAVERVFVRPLRRQGPTAQTVGTVAVLGLRRRASSRKIYGTTPLHAPRDLPRGRHHASRGDAAATGEIGLFVVALAGGGALLAFFQFTDLGLAMRGAAENRAPPRSMGVNPDRTAGVAWAARRRARRARPASCSRPSPT